MTEFKKIKSDYEKLKKEYPLPEFKDFMFIFGYPKEDDLKSVVTLFFACKKTPSNAAQWLVGLMSPQDNISAQDQRFTKHMRDELMHAMKTCVVAGKKFSIVSFEASQGKDPEKALAESIAEATRELKPVAELFKRILKTTLKGWEKADTEEDHVSYRW